MHGDGQERAEGFELLADARDAAVGERSSMAYAPMIDRQIAREKMRRGDTDGAIDMLRGMAGNIYEDGGVSFLGPTVDALVEALLTHGTPADIREAQTAVDRLAAAPRDPGLVLLDVHLLPHLRALLAQARNDHDEYCDLRDRYRAMANNLGYEGHMKWAAEMP